MNNKNHESIIPSIKEAERFIQYLNKRFDLKLPFDIIVNIEQTDKHVKGYFRSTYNPERYAKGKRPLNQICLSSHFLIDDPLETITHETAHYYNFVNNIKDSSGHNYHNKHFKTTAERLLLKVDKGLYGYAYTSRTKEFNNMIKEFKPNKDAFKIFQNKSEKGKTPNRNRLFICSCGTKVRTALNVFKPFNATCDYCHTKFILQEQP